MDSTITEPAVTVTMTIQEALDVHNFLDDAIGETYPNTAEVRLRAELGALLEDAEIL